MKLKVTLYVTIITFAITSCGVTGKHASDDSLPIEMKYSELLTMEQHDGYVTARITDPWDSTRTLHSYVLVPREEKLPDNLPDGDVIRTPIYNAVVYTSVHCGLIDELGAYDKIKGICDLQYINLPKLHKDVARGKIADLGETMTPNIEGLIDISPDAVMLSPFENSGSYGKLGKLGIPLIECADYMERTPLGRAEWIRFYGMLLGRQHEADSIFASVEQSYDDTRREAQQYKSRPTVVTEMKIGSTWYIAGGNSTVAILIDDAGGDYIFKNLHDKGAVPYSPEVAFEKAKDADFWLAEIQNARALIEREEQQKEEEDSDYVPLYEDEKLQKISELINPSGQATGTSKMQIRRYEGYGRLIPEMRALTRFGLSANTLYIAYSHTPKLTEEQQRQLADEVEAYFQQESGDGADNTKELSRGDFQRMVRGVADGKKPSKTPKRPDYATRLGGLEKNLVRSLRKARTDEDRQTALDEIGRLRQTLDELEEELKA